MINALLASRDDLRIVVRTSAARWLFDLTVTGPVDLHRTDTDTGIVQIDSLHLDEEATVQRAREFMRTFDDRVEREAAFLSEVHASLVVSDLPPLGIAAAARASVPAAALGNFTWDWIYSAYPGTEDLVRAIADA